MYAGFEIKGLYGGGATFMSENVGLFRQSVMVANLTTYGTSSSGNNRSTSIAALPLHYTYTKS